MPTRYTDNVRLAGLVSVPVQWFTTVPGIVKGDFVTLETDGTIAEAADTSAAILGRVISIDEISGKTCVALAVPGVSFQVKADAAITDALVGDHVDLVKDATTDEHLADVGAGSTKVFRIDSILNATARQLFVSVPVAKSSASGVEIS